MAKLSLINRVITPTKRSGAKKNLLKRDGITSDGDGIPDDGSSSLSERQEKGRSKSKKKFGKFWRQFSSKNGVQEDGYESSSDASTGSTRSTSSAFLRFQNTRSIWKTKLMKKSVLQRREDGSEIPVENETKPWPMFDKIYKTQNQLLKKGELDEDDERESDDDDHSGSVESGDCHLAPPAPIFTIGLGSEECVDIVGFDVEVESVIYVSVGAGSSEESVERRTNESQKKSIDLTKESLDGLPESNSESSHVDASLAAVQENGIQIADSSPVDSIPASGTPNSPQAGFVAQAETTHQSTSGNSRTFPTQKLTQSSTPDSTPKNSKPVLASAKKPPRPSRKKKKNTPNEERKDITPRSIPRTICYSLRSAIGDGSEKQRNSHTLMDRRPLRPNGCSVDVSYWSHRGKRNYMEDRFVIEHMGSTSKDKKNTKPISLLAVFDGHGGSAASQFCSDWISSYIRKKNEHFPENLPLAMKSSFTKIDDDVVRSGYFDGTTACAVTIVGNKVICCNAGDSRAIIVKRDGTAIDLSQDHKPDRNDETKRINALGGRVIHWGRWRVEGVLAVSRSIGDAKLKPYVTAEPDLVEHEIGEDDMFLVVASDGVWDTMSSDLVAKFVLVNTCKIVDKSLQVDEKLLRWIARQVSKRAKENGSKDNISCIVAHLKG